MTTQTPDPRAGKGHNGGKGFLHGKKPLASRPTEHIYRNPRCRPTAGEISGLSTTVDIETRSRIKPLAEHIPFSASVGGLLQHAATQCRRAFDVIVARCEAKGRKFFDKSWSLTDRATMYPPASPDDCTVSEPCLVARLSDLFPNGELFVSRSTAQCSIKQGAIGNCFFIGALSALTHSILREVVPIRQLVVAHSFKWGIYGLVFFKNGGWEWVIIDDFIAVEGKSPLYASCSTNDVWPLVVEKAYAKVHYSWDTIDGGWTHEALVDMTGGREELLDLYNAHENMPFEEFEQICNNCAAVVTCTLGEHVPEPSAIQRLAVDTTGPRGLLRGHAYSIAETRQTSDGCCFVRVRNPWGRDGAWLGPYSANSNEWKRCPQHLNELGGSTVDGSTFWMRWDDFRKYLSDIAVCEVHDSRSGVVTVFNKAKRNPLCPDQTYILHVRGTVKIPMTIILGQEDPKALPDHSRAKCEPYAMLRLSVFRLKKVPERYADLQSCLAERLPTPRVYNRVVANVLFLERGDYSLIAQLSDCPSNIGYYLRFIVADPSNSVSLFRLDNRHGTFISSDPSEPPPYSATPEGSISRRAPGVGLTGMRLTRSRSFYDVPYQDPQQVRSFPSQGPTPQPPEAFPFIRRRWAPSPTQF